MLKTCIVCGKPAKNKYCSRKCYFSDPLALSNMVKCLRQGNKTRQKNRIGRTMNRGYFYIWKPDHPNATRTGYVFEHRLVAEQKIGRYLNKNEIAHHINGDKTDNRPENIDVIIRSNHSKLHRYKYIKEHNKKCLVSGCTNIISSKGGLCRHHYLINLNKKIQFNNILYKLISYL